MSVSVIRSSTTSSLLTYGGIRELAHLGTRLRAVLSACLMACLLGAALACGIAPRLMSRLCCGSQLEFDWREIGGMREEMQTEIMELSSKQRAEKEKLAAQRGEQPRQRDQPESAGLALAGQARQPSRHMPRHPQ